MGKYNKFKPFLVQKYFIYSAEFLYENAGVFIMQNTMGMGGLPLGEKLTMKVRGKNGKKERRRKNCIMNGVKGLKLPFIWGY